MRETRAVLTVAAAGILTLLVGALAVGSDRAFTIGVLSAAPSPPVAPGERACQQPITVPPGGGFDTVDFEIGTYLQPAGPPVDVSVEPVDPGAFPIRRGVLQAGYPDVGIEQRQRVHVGDVPEGARIAVCFRNRGPRRVALFGAAGAAARESKATIGGRHFDFDFDVVFRDGRRSFAERLSQIVQRASLFRPPWLTPGVYYALIVILLIGLPALIARAARDLAAPQADVHPDDRPRATLGSPGGR